MWIIYVYGEYNADMQTGWVVALLYSLYFGLWEWLSATHLHGPGLFNSID